MIKIKTLLENTINDNGQFFDIGVEFSSFTHSLKIASKELIDKYQVKINQYLKGKRVIAKSSRGYKQVSSKYQFDINNVTIENYYGNYVIIASDMSSKPKKYFLATDEKIKIIGQATGQPSPQKGINPAQIKKQEEPSNDNIHNSNPSVNTSNINKPQITNIKEDEKDLVNVTKNYESYSIDNIIEDVDSWLPLLLKKQETPLVDLVKKIGWTDHKEHGIVVSVFELKLPFSVLKYDNITNKELQNLFYNKAPTLKLIKLEQNKKEQYWDLQIKKIYREK
jgi:hypothetical protein